MVCISCIVIPVFLWLWHKYLQPLVLRFWGPLPWGTPQPVDSTTDPTVDADKETSNTTCPFSSKSKDTSNGVIANGHSPHVGEVTSSEIEHKKVD
jgi:hypothetical protein